MISKQRYEVVAKNKLELKEDMYNTPLFVKLRVISRNYVETVRTNEMMSLVAHSENVKKDDYLSLRGSKK